MTGPPISAAPPRPAYPPLYIAPPPSSVPYQPPFLAASLDPTALALALPGLPLSAPTSLTGEDEVVFIKGGSGPGRRSRFNLAEDLVLLREVAAVKAHIANNGETRERF